MVNPAATPNQGAYPAAIQQTTPAGGASVAVQGRSQTVAAQIQNLRVELPYEGLVARGKNGQIYYVTQEQMLKALGSHEVIEAVRIVILWNEWLQKLQQANNGVPRPN